MAACSVGGVRRRNAEQRRGVAAWHGPLAAPPPSPPVHGAHLQQLVLEQLDEHVEAERHKLIVRHDAVLVGVHLLHQPVDFLALCTSRTRKGAQWRACDAAVGGSARCGAVRR
eukprot:264628-Prymnesium_polylepis.1